MTATARDDRITTRNATGKRGVRIDRGRYEAMKAALLRIIPADEEGVPAKELGRRAAPHLERTAFPPEASRTWYAVVVKLDLEARGLVERVPGKRPQHVRRPR